MVHILNGDSLKAQFPKTVKGAQIVCRECLVDGHNYPLDLQELFKVRAAYLDYTDPDGFVFSYYKMTVPEFSKMQNIAPDREICLWFEDDVFCQVNFWFCVYLLTLNSTNDGLYLVRPPRHTPYGFAGLTPDQLKECLANRTRIDEPQSIAQLWSFYATKDYKSLNSKGMELAKKYPFILEAIQAYLDSLPTEDSLGRPTESLLKIRAELGTDQFGPVFREFNKREAIYGYGDLQVKKIWDSLPK